MHLDLKRLTQGRDAGASVLDGKVPAHPPLLWMVVRTSLQRFILTSSFSGSNWLKTGE